LDEPKIGVMDDAEREAVKVSSKSVCGGTKCDTIRIA
jgi:hypothetical protein